MATHDNKSSGYLIPDDPAPDDLNCLLVFYPDDPLYLAALLGSLTYLGTWAAWQRDPDKRGRLAAAAWKAANECTLDSMSCITDLVTVLQEIRDAINNQELSVNLGEVSLDVSPLLPALTGIQTAIEEKECTCSCHSGEEDMSITINNCNCCCGGGSNLSPGLPPGWSGPPDDVPPGTLPPDPPQPPEFWPPVTEPDTYDYQSAQCAMAHYMLITLRTVALAMVERQYSQANIVAKLSEFFPGVGWGWAGSVAQLALNIMANLAMMTSNVADVAREIDNMSNGIKCAWLNPDGTTAERMSNARVLVDTMALPIWTRYALKQLMGYLPIAELWNRETLTYIGSYLETTGYYAAGCPPCVSVDPGDGLPTSPASYIWSPAIDIYRSAGMTPTIAKQGNTLFISVSSSGDRWIEISCPGMINPDCVGMLWLVSQPDGSHMRNYMFPAQPHPPRNLSGVYPLGSEAIVWMNKGAPILDWGENHPDLESAHANGTLVCRWEFPFSIAGEVRVTAYYLIREF